MKRFTVKFTAEAPGVYFGMSFVVEAESAVDALAVAGEKMRTIIAPDAQLRVIKVHAQMGEDARMA